MDRLTFPSPSGPLAGYLWPKQDPRAVLQIVHGMAEHAARYGYVAKAFVERGFAVVAHDHRGHGETAEPAAKGAQRDFEGALLGHMGDDDSWTRAVEDVHFVRRQIGERFPKVPVVQLAHSMGSFMAQQQLYQYPGDYAAVALSGSNGKPPAIAALGRGVTRIERMRLGKRKPSALLQKLSFGDFNKGFEGRTDFDWLSREPGQVDAYVADPHCGFALTVQSWVDMLDALGELTKPRNLASMRMDLPIYLLAGSDDPVGERGKGVERLRDAYRGAGVTNVTLKLWDGGRHEILNETNRDQVINELLSFYETALA